MTYSTKKRIRKNWIDKIENFEKSDNLITVPKDTLLKIIHTALYRERIHYINKQREWRNRGIALKMNFDILK